MRSELEIQSKVDKYLLVLYSIISLLAIALAVFGIIHELSPADSILQNDPEVIYDSSKSLQSPILQPIFAHIDRKTFLEALKEEIDIQEEEQNGDGYEPELEKSCIITLENVRITHYCPCTKCCGQWANGITSTGRTAQAGHTVAVDPRIIPYGSTVTIRGHSYIAEDRGPNGRVIDIFVDSHEEAIQLGTYITTVEVELQ